MASLIGYLGVNGFVVTDTIDKTVQTHSAVNQFSQTKANGLVSIFLYPHGWSYFGAVSGVQVTDGVARVTSIGDFGIDGGPSVKAKATLLVKPEGSGYKVGYRIENLSGGVLKESDDPDGPIGLVPFVPLIPSTPVQWNLA